MQRLTHATIALLTFNAFAFPALAQDGSNERLLVEPGGRADADAQEEDRAAPDQEPPAVSISLQGNQRFFFDTEIDDGDASVFLSRTAGSVDFTFRPSSRLSLTVGVGGAVSVYEVDNAGDFLPGLDDDPFDEFYAPRITARGFYAIDRTWGVFAGGDVLAAFESGADFGDSITGGGFGGVQWTPSADLSIGFGVLAQTRLEDDTLVIPIVTLDWQVNEKVNVLVQGPGARINVDVCPMFTVHLFGRLGVGEFRLSDDHAVARDGIFRDWRVLVGAGATWRPLDGLEVFIEGGASVYRQLEILDSGGDELVEEETDPSAMLAFGLRYDF